MGSTHGPQACCSHSVSPPQPLSAVQLPWLQRPVSQTLVAPYREMHAGSSPLTHPTQLLFLHRLPLPQSEGDRQPTTQVPPLQI